VGAAPSGDRGVPARPPPRGGPTRGPRVVLQARRRGASRPNPCRVCFLSGESGQATLQSTARRVARAKGLNLADLDILWGFKLPQFANALQVAALRAALETNNVGLLLFDPLYLALLAGQGPGGLSAANLYEIGPLLLSGAEACLAVGRTPVLFHHFKFTRKDGYAEPQLEDLAFAGVQEFARQWLLLGPRSPFDGDAQLLGFLRDQEAQAHRGGEEGAAGGRFLDGAGGFLSAATAAII
jgi:hypothetical protein